MWKLNIIGTIVQFSLFIVYVAYATKNGKNSWKVKKIVKKQYWDNKNSSQQFSFNQKKCKDWVSEGELDRDGFDK